MSDDELRSITDLEHRRMLMNNWARGQEMTWDEFVEHMIKFKQTLKQMRNSQQPSPNIVLFKI